MSRAERRILLLYEVREFSPRLIATRLNVSEAEALRQLARAITHFNEEVHARAHPTVLQCS